jgi:hypothetical protein
MCTYFSKLETQNLAQNPKLVLIILKPHFIITLIKLDQNRAIIG